MALVSITNLEFKQRLLLCFAWIQGQKGENKGFLIGYHIF